jgi:hypothetical protein
MSIRARALRSSMSWTAARLHSQLDDEGVALKCAAVALVRRERDQHRERTGRDADLVVQRVESKADRVLRIVTIELDYAGAVAKQLCAIQLGGGKQRTDDPLRGLVAERPLLVLAAVGRTIQPARGDIAE